MKKPWALFIFISGFTLGCLVRFDVSSKHQPPPPEAKRVTKSARPSKPSPQQSAHSSKWLSIGKNAKDFSYDEKRKFLESLPAQDRMTALEAFAAQAGLKGLDYQVESMMESILSQWADENFSDAWDSALRQPSDGLREFMTSELLNHLAKSDPQRAFDLHLEQLAIHPKFHSSAPSTLLSANLKVGTSEYLATLAKLPFGNGSVGSDEEFAENFDFEAAMEGVENLRKSQKNLQPSNFPSNFFYEWAKRDREAVYAWWSQSKTTLPFNDLGDIIKAVEIENPEAASAWVADKLLGAGEDREKIIQCLATASSDQVGIRNSGIARTMPNQAASDVFLTEILLSDGYSNTLERHDYAMTGLSSTTARLQAIRQLKEKHRAFNLAEIRDERLRAWGISRAQIEAISQSSTE
jgi:hypothetical protein